MVTPFLLACSRIQVMFTQISSNKYQYQQGNDHIGRLNVPKQRTGNRIRHNGQFANTPARNVNLSAGTNEVVNSHIAAFVRFEKLKGHLLRKLKFKDVDNSLTRTTQSGSRLYYDHSIFTFT